MPLKQVMPFPGYLLGNVVLKKVHLKYFRYGESEYKNALVKLPEAVLNRMK